jgi:hypothetical protein
MTQLSHDRTSGLLEVLQAWLGLTNGVFVRFGNIDCRHFQHSMVYMTESETPRMEAMMAVGREVERDV